MLVIGVTGGIGAGKSQVLNLLKEIFSAEIIQADQVAKQLEEPGEPGYEKLTGLFGTDILDQEGRIDPKILGNKIFSDETALKQVNQIIHPLTWNRIQRKIAESAAHLIAVEAALFDVNCKEICQYLVYIDTDQEIRIKRLMENRGYSREKCLTVMGNQKRRGEYLEIADYVIDNSGSLEYTEKQLRQMIKSMQAKEQIYETC